MKIFFLSSQDVIGAMNMNPHISFPPEVDFFLIGDLITETCKVAFAMQTLEPPLDISFASDGELYNENKSVFCAKLKFCVNLYKNVSQGKYMLLHQLFYSLGH